MKKIFSIVIFIGSFITANATPGTGGYFGHRLIIAGETSVSPFYAVPACFTHFDVQYGGNIGIIAARRTQVNLFYNMYSLSGNDIYDDSQFGSDDRIQGKQFGLTVRSFQKKRGGVAPIGKFMDLSLAYSTNHLRVGVNNPNFSIDDVNAPADLATVTPSIGLGSQGLYWGRVVLGAGFRLGRTLPLAIGSNIMSQHLKYKDYFSTFFTAGILL